MGGPAQLITHIMEIIHPDIVGAPWSLLDVGDEQDHRVGALPLWDGAPLSALHGSSAPAPGTPRKPKTPEPLAEEACLADKSMHTIFQDMNLRQ